jgi:predicted methyltransferase
MSDKSLWAFARSCVAAFSAAIALAACSKTEAPVAPAPVQRTSLIAEAIASTDRLAGDSDEDIWRQPNAVLDFMGVEPGMDVLDYFAASGYYSELLARSVGPAGSVIVYNNPEYAQFSGEKLIKRFENNRLPNAKVVTVATNALKLEPNSLDGVLFVMSYHDLYWTPKDAKAPLGDPAQVTASLFAAVKPGGVVVVLDHVAGKGSDTVKVVDSLHRIDPDVVKGDFGKAGFSFEEASTALQHPDDDHSKLVFDEAIRHKTDQFIYRFRKPKEH